MISLTIFHFKIRKEFCKKVLINQKVMFVYEYEATMLVSNLNNQLQLF